MGDSVETKPESTSSRNNSDSTHKRIRFSENYSDPQINEIVSILGKTLLTVQVSVAEKTEAYAPSAAVTFLLRRMDVDTKDLISREIYYLMTAFMTVYLCFIQVLLQHYFDSFMQLFDIHDSLSTPETQPFLWFYALEHRSIVQDLQQQLTGKGFEPQLIIAHMDTIFSKFYTQYFLEISAQKHQKDHGQFYTPQSVIQFMWNRCASLPQMVQLMQEKKPVPSIFDPCLGIGSFLNEYLTRFIEVCRLTVWNDADRLTDLLLRDIPDHIWGIEIDPFAYQLCKTSVMVHLFPLYERLCELNVQLPSNSIHRFRLFCNDSLKLRVESNPFWNADTVDLFESDCLDQLRDASKLKFDFIVTNPPYMIRKTGFITEPDPLIYDESKLGGRMTQAYAYFMWICLQRCDDQNGQVCLITPSQWTVLEFAQHIRDWIWENCKLLDMYEFEPFKIWPKVQTDSLIFRVCKRTAVLPNTNLTVYLRHKSRKISLAQQLQVYHDFRPDQSPSDPDFKFKCTPLTDDNRKLMTKHSSLAFILPSATCLEELNNLTEHLPRLCDGESSKSGTNGSLTPLVWNRGPNTNPVYSLVVRTQWALETFGQEVCSRWLKPCFYWNGKTMTSVTGGGKEGDFWKDRDPLRLKKKETSAADAYWPYCTLDTECPTRPFYSMITVNKEDADTLKAEYDSKGAYAPSAKLYCYLKEARLALQAKFPEKDIAYCQYNKNGTDVSVKIVHPINCGYFTRSQPRSRYFVDKTQVAVTNQCIYFTIKPNYPWQDFDYFCGLLNSTLIQFFTKIHCSYDQQGRMRYFGRFMAYIPFAPPLSEEFMHQVATLAQGVTVARTWLYTFVRYSTDGHKLMDRVRNFEWNLTSVERSLLHQFNPPPNWTLQPYTSLSTYECPDHLQWINDFVRRTYANESESVERIAIVLLKISSLFQLAIDQMVYYIYKIPEHLQLAVEEELHLEGLRKDWASCPDYLIDPSDVTKWHQHILLSAFSFTTNELNTILSDNAPQSEQDGNISITLSTVI